MLSSFHYIAAVLVSKDHCHREETGAQGKLPGRENTNERGEMSIPGGEVSLYRATELNGDYDYIVIE